MLDAGKWKSRTRADADMDGSDTNLDADYLWDTPTRDL